MCVNVNEYECVYVCVCVRVSVCVCVSVCDMCVYLTYHATKHISSAEIQYITITVNLLQ